MRRENIGSSTLWTMIRINFHFRQQNPYSNPFCSSWIRWAEVTVWNYTKSTKAKWQKRVPLRCIHEASMFQRHRPPLKHVSAHADEMRHTSSSWSDDQSLFRLKNKCASFHGNKSICKLRIKKESWKLLHVENAALYPLKRRPNINHNSKDDDVEIWDRRALH